MLKRLHRGWSEFPEQLDIIDCVRNYFLMQKMIFSSMPNTYFRVAQISWNDNLSVNWQGIVLVKAALSRWNTIQATFLERKLLVATVLQTLSLKQTSRAFC